MANVAAVGIQDVAARLEQLRDLRFWKVWRSIGSHLFFDTGEPRITVAGGVRPYEVNGHPVERRSNYIRSSHGMHIQMAAGLWIMKANRSRTANPLTVPSANSLFGQSLVGVTPRGDTAMDLTYDLGAHIALRRHDDANDDEPLLTVWDDRLPDPLGRWWR